MIIMPKQNQAPPTTKEEETKASAHRSNWTLVVKVNVARYYNKKNIILCMHEQLPCTLSVTITMKGNAHKQVWEWELAF